MMKVVLLGVSGRLRRQLGHRRVPATFTIMQSLALNIVGSLPICEEVRISARGLGAPTNSQSAPDIDELALEAVW